MKTKTNQIVAVPLNVIWIKKLKKEEKRQSDSSSSIKDKAEKTELRTGFITFLFTPLVLSNDYKMISVESLPNHFLTSVFHPPAL